MNKLQLTAVAATLAALISSPAFADASASAGVTMGGPSNPTCTLSPMTMPSAQGATLASGGTSSATTVNLIDLANAADATYIPGNGFTLSFTGMCNYSARVSVQTISGRIKATTTANNPVSGSLPFLQSLDYTANASWGAKTASLTANGVALKKTSSLAVGGANTGTGTLTVSITDPADTTLPMQAGTWTDTIKLQIGAAL